MSEQSVTFPRASFFRRFASMIYDTLTAIAVGACAAMVAIVTLVVLMENGLIDMYGYEHSSDVIQNSILYTSIIQGWVLFWVVYFFVWFWQHGGQTVGMRAWRLRIYSTNDQPMGYGRAALRLITALGGLGTLLVLLDFKQKQSLQDRIANTEVLVLTAEANHHRNW